MVVGMICFLVSVLNRVVQIFGKEFVKLGPICQIILFGVLGMVAQLNFGMINDYPRLIVSLVTELCLYLRMKLIL